MAEQNRENPTSEEMLAETQQKLAEAEQQLAQARAALEEKENSKKQKNSRPIESIYAKIDVPVKYVDYFIAAVVIAFVLVVGIGILKGNGII